MSAPAAASLDLWLFVRCHDRLLAFAADWIERVLLPEDVPPVRPAAAMGLAQTAASAACLGSIELDGVAYPAWDLGLLLGLPAVAKAWILLRLPRLQGTLPLALRTDECLHIGPLPARQTSRLPPGIVGTRPRAYRCAFTAAVLRAKQRPETPVGLEIDLGGLWTDDELSVAEELRRRSQDGQEGRHVPA